MRMNKFILAVAALTIAPFSVSAQDSCGCSSALDANLMDVFVQRFGSETSFTSRSELCEKAKSEEASGKSANANIGYGGFTLGGGASKTKSSSSLREFCESDFVNQDDQRKSEIVRRSVNPVLAESFAQCIKACANTRFGVEVAQPSDRAFTLNVKPKQGKTIVRDFVVIADDVLRDFNEEDGISCKLQVNGLTIQPRFDLGADSADSLPLEVEEGNSASVTCARNRENVSASDGRTLDFFSGYAVHLKVNDTTLNQYVTTKALEPMTSIEAAEIQERIDRLEVEIAKEAEEKLQLISADRDRIEGLQNALLRRTWHNMKSSRTINGSYKNGRKYPIEVSVVGGGPGKGDNSNSCDARIYVAGKLISYSRDNWRNAARLCFVTATVPPGAAYQVKMEAYPSKSGRIISWMELY